MELDKSTSLEVYLQNVSLVEKIRTYTFIIY